MIEKISQITKYNKKIAEKHNIGKLEVIENYNLIFSKISYEANYKMIESTGHILTEQEFSDLGIVALSINENYYELQEKIKNNHISELVQAIDMIAEKYNKSRDLILLEYSIIQKEVENRHDSCKGIKHDIETHTQTCMNCIGYRALNEMINKYDVEKND